jgi:A/G-specific adenine glycosylase
LKTLRGIGDYTAAAIASIAFNEPVAAVDGNVSRVFSRLYGIELPINSSDGKKLIQKLAGDNLDRESPGNSNQALMEFGALLCKPANPKCEVCPLCELCNSHADGTINQLPVKIVRKRSKIRWFNYFVITRDNIVFLQKRESKDIWKSLFQFPLLETTDDKPAELALEEFLNNMTLRIQNFTLSSVSNSFTHLLTHQTIKARFFHLELHENFINRPNDWQKVKWEEMDNYPIPRLIEKYLERF